MSRMARVICSVDSGAKRRAAAFATSGMAELFEHATARAQAIASKIGNPKPS